MPVSPISAALIIADKSDVRRSRVKNTDLTSFDIHDRVNYPAEKSELEVVSETKEINLRLKIDLNMCTVADYFEIFLGRMIMSSRASAFLGGHFHLFINDTKLL